MTVVGVPPYAKRKVIAFPMPEPEPVPRPFPFLIYPCFYSAQGNYYFPSDFSIFQLFMGFRDLFERICFIYIYF